jgi:ATP-dependent Lon protease
VLARVISRYTREAGVRELERVLGRLTRKLTLREAEGGIPGVQAGELSDLDELLGPERYLPESGRQELSR